MGRKLFPQFIFFVVLILGGIFSGIPESQAATGQGVDVYVDGILLDGNPIFNENNWTPGDSITKTIELKNLTDKSLSVDLVITEEPSGILAEKLKITITGLSNTFTYGPKTLKDFFGNSPLHFSNIGANATDSYKFKIEFPPATDTEDNKYNYNDKNSLHYADGARCNTVFDLKFSFAEITTVTTITSGGNGPEWFWQNTNPEGGTVQAVATSPIKKVFQAIKLPKKLPRVGAWSALVAASLGLIATVVVYRKNKK